MSTPGSTFAHAVISMTAWGYQRSRPGSTRCPTLNRPSGRHLAGQRIRDRATTGPYGHRPRSRWADHLRRKARVALLRDIGSALSLFNQPISSSNGWQHWHCPLPAMRKTRRRSSTTHSQLTPQEEEATGVSDGYVRLSVGIEHVDDIIAISSEVLPPLEISQAAEPGPLPTLPRMREREGAQDWKNRFRGRGRPRFSRSVTPRYSRRNRPRRCSSGTAKLTKSSSPAGR
jgi:hypothetical protein